jgi:hypothetical protein
VNFLYRGATEEQIVGPICEKEMCGGCGFCGEGEGKEQGKGGDEEGKVIRDALARRRRT